MRNLFQWKLEDNLPLIEFAYTNNYGSRIKMTHFEALYGRRYNSLVGWFEVSEMVLVGLDLVFGL